MTDQTATEPVDSYGLVLPDPWHEVPLDAAGQRSMLDAAAKALANTEGWSTTHRRRLEVSMAHYNAAMAAMRATYGAAYLDLWPADDDADADADADAEPLLVSANCAIGSLSRSDLGVDMALTAPTLLIAASNEHVFAESTDRRIVATSNLAPPEIIELPAGDAVRLRRHQFIRTDLGSARGVFSETFLVPHGPVIPGDEGGDRCCVLAFATSNDALANDFSPLFLRIAQTLKLLRSGDPTVVDNGRLH